MDETQFVSSTAQSRRFATPPIYVLDLSVTRSRIGLLNGTPQSEIASNVAARPGDGIFSRDEKEVDLNAAAGGKDGPLRVIDYRSERGFSISISSSSTSSAAADDESNEPAHLCTLLRRITDTGRADSSVVRQRAAGAGADFLLQADDEAPPTESKRGGPPTLLPSIADEERSKAKKMKRRKVDHAADHASADEINTKDKFAVMAIEPVTTAVSGSFREDVARALFSHEGTAAIALCKRAQVAMFAHGLTSGLFVDWEKDRFLQVSLVEDGFVKASFDCGLELDNSTSGFFYNALSRRGVPPNDVRAEIGSLLTTVLKQIQCGADVVMKRSENDDGAEKPDGDIDRQCAAGRREYEPDLVLEDEDAAADAQDDLQAEVMFASSLPTDDQLRSGHELKADKAVRRRLLHRLPLLVLSLVQYVRRHKRLKAGFPIVCEHVEVYQVLQFCQNFGYSENQLKSIYELHGEERAGDGDHEPPAQAGGPSLAPEQDEKSSASQAELPAEVKEDETKLVAGPPRRATRGRGRPPKVAAAKRAAKAKSKATRTPAGASASSASSALSTAVVSSGSGESLLQLPRTLPILYTENAGWYGAATLAALYEPDLGRLERLRNLRTENFHSAVQGTAVAPSDVGESDDTTLGSSSTLNRLESLWLRAADGVQTWLSREEFSTENGKTRLYRKCP